MSDFNADLKDFYLAIDLIGYPGQFENAFGLDQYRILNRAGIRVFPLPYSNWFFQKVETQTKFLHFIESHTD